MRSSAHVRVGNLALSAACVGVLAALACAQPSAEQQIEERRAQYEVQLTSFAVEDVPQLPPVEADPTAPGETEGVATTPPVEAISPGEAGAGATDAVSSPVPTTTKIVLDMLVTTSANEVLPGLTVELEQIGPGGAVKMERQLWLDVSRVARGAAAQITHTVEDIDYQEGDGFAVSIRSPIPPG